MRAFEFIPSRSEAKARDLVRRGDRNPAMSLEVPPSRSARRRDQLGAFLVAALLLLAPSVASACPVCYGAPGDPMTKGVSNGVWVLLGFVGFVQIGFVAMFWSFWRRARAQRRFRESLRVIHPLDQVSDKGVPLP